MKLEQFYRCKSLIHRSQRILACYNVDILQFCCHRFHNRMYFYENDVCLLFSPLFCETAPRSLLHFRIQSEATCLNYGLVPTPSLKVVERGDTPDRHGLLTCARLSWSCWSLQSSPSTNAARFAGICGGVGAWAEGAWAEGGAARLARHGMRAYTRSIRPRRGGRFGGPWTVLAGSGRSGLSWIPKIPHV